jgi:putative flippase GtrA
MAKRVHKQVLLYYLIKRITIFLFAVTALCGGFYVIGNIQGFLDDTQRMLLDLTKILGVSAAIGAGYGFAINLILTFKDKDLHRLGSCFLYLVVTAISVSIAVIVAFISSWLVS